MTHEILRQFGLGIRARNALLNNYPDAATLDAYQQNLIDDNYGRALLKKQNVGPVTVSEIQRRFFPGLNEQKIAEEKYWSMLRRSPRLLSIELEKARSKVKRAETSFRKAQANLAAIEAIDTDSNP